MTDCGAIRRVLEAGAAAGGAEIRLARDERAPPSDCAPCRAPVAAADPSALFALLAIGRSEPGSWLGFETRIMAEIRSEPRRRSALAAFLRPRSAVLALGASL